MTKKKCPLGEACDLTTAWMLGAARARDNISAGHLHLQLKVNRIGEGYIENDPGVELDCVMMDGAFNLRAVAEGLRQGPDRVTPLEEQVKAQAAEIKRLMKERDAAVHLARMRKAYIEEARDERDAFEAKLAKAVRLLRQHCYPLDMSDEDAATLAALTGDKP